MRKVRNGQTTVWVYDAFGNLAAEYTTATWTDTGVYYRTTDHLGSTRVVTDDTAAVKSRLDYFPFGEQLDTNRSARGAVKDAGAATYNAAAGMRQKFTGQERDGETGLDYYWARRYVAYLARFSSIDPRNAGALREEPQTWGAYTYVANRPLTFVDPLGLSMIGLCPPTLGSWFGEYDPDPLCLDGHGDPGGVGWGSSDWSVTVVDVPLEMPSFDLSSWSQTGTGGNGNVLSGQPEEGGTDPEVGGVPLIGSVTLGVPGLSFPPVIGIGAVVSVTGVVDRDSRTWCVGLGVGGGNFGAFAGAMIVAYPDPITAIQGLGYSGNLGFGGGVAGGYGPNDPSVQGDEVAWAAFGPSSIGGSLTYGYTGCTEY